MTLFIKISVFVSIRSARLFFQSSRLGILIDDQLTIKWPNGTKHNSQIHLRSTWLRIFFYWFFYSKWRSFKENSFRYKDFIVKLTLYPYNMSTEGFLHKTKAGNEKRLFVVPVTKTNPPTVSRLVVVYKTCKAHVVYTFAFSFFEGRDNIDHLILVNKNKNGRTIFFLSFSHKNVKFSLYL